MTRRAYIKFLFLTVSWLQSALTREPVRTKELKHFQVEESLGEKEFGAFLCGHALIRPIGEQRLPLARLSRYIYFSSIEKCVTSS